MYDLDIIIKSITLLYRESLLPDNTNNSTDLIRKVMKPIKTEGDYVMMGNTNEVIANLKKYTLDLCENTDRPIDKEMIRQSIALILGNDTNTLDILIRTIDKELSEEELVKVILVLKRHLNKYFKEHEIGNILSNAHYRFKNHRSEINDPRDFLDKVIANLETINGSSDILDPAIANEIDLENTHEIEEVLSSLNEDEIKLPKMRTGWQGLNTMFNGGFRRGEMILLASLQHKYKSGTTNSLFAQLAMYNKPVMIDPKKKPLIVLISLEDDMEITTDFLYRYLYYSEHGKLPDFKNVKAKEVAEYIKEKLTATGYNIKMLRVNPTDWSYKAYADKMMSYEEQGFELHATFMDYAGMLPTVGCNTTGPMGTDLRDLLRRIRNFNSVRKCAFFTPWQLSVDAKQLIRNGVPEATFVKELVGKGYTSGTKQIDQEVDAEFYIHIAKLNGKASLTFARDKHRTPAILEEEYKYFYMPFPKGAPMPPDINNEKSSAVFPDADGLGEDGGFDF